ncbi:hypothetical protein Tsubulata_048804 [Turnera subulata]|uniref:TF-B3 domain-containing protein n=1 Tax=Turnera subulata TaxID=218843 RepID=A0A9Q0FWC6_9ROSI|nr:hypothetical protein Tsubulata_048804 [Turnera subulata]
MKRKNTRSNTRRDITLFFKIIFPLTVAEQMRIPKKFAMHNGGELEDVAKLFLPNGRVWEMRISKGREEISLAEGWPEFVEHYSLHNDHFLIFKYKGRSNFKVRIFDVSGSEMQYPPVEMDETSDSGEETNRSQKIRRQAGPSRAYKTRKNKGSIQFTFKPTKLRHSSLETLEAVHEAEKLETRGPSFMALLSKSDMKSCRVYVPQKFAETYLTEEGDNDTVQIESSEGRQWDVVLHYAKGRNSLSVGWANFARDNHLKAGDVLVFELLNRRHVALQCTIFRAGSMSRREFPVFCIPILQDMNPRIPPQFMSHYGNELADAATLILPNGQVWEIGLSKGLDETFLDSCWLEFAENYSIGVGHFLYFKYKGQSRFKVHIFDKSCCEIRSLRPATGGVGSSRANIRPIRFGITACRSNRASLASQKALREADKYETRNPSFVVLLGKSEMNKSQWFVPVKFAETYLMHIGKTDTKAINIKGSDGTQWQVQMCKIVLSGMDGYFLFQIRGCAGIVAEYDLKIEDVLLFELLDMEDALLQLHIFRAH